MSVSATAEPGTNAPSEASFKREGEYWTVIYQGEPVRVRDAKGMRYLARLLAHPGQELHVLDLVGTGGGEGAAPISSRDDLGTDGLGDAGAGLDAEAKAAYRRRLQELREALAEAERFNDGERAARFRAEIGQFTDQLAAAIGLGGRDRRAASAAERARLSVRGALHAAIRRIDEQRPDLGLHLKATVRTGTYCAYTPDPRVPLTWEL